MYARSCQPAPPRRPRPSCCRTSPGPWRPPPGPPTGWWPGSVRAAARGSRTPRQGGLWRLMWGVLWTCTGASTVAPGSAVPSSPVAASPRLWPHNLLVLGEVRGHQSSPAPSPAPSPRTVAGSSTHWVVEQRTCRVQSVVTLLTSTGLCTDLHAPRAAAGGLTPALVTVLHHRVALLHLLPVVLAHRV